MKAIETHNLTKTFNGVIAVDRVNLSVEEGEIFGFLGPNGAGKTTTVKLLTTLLRPTSGTAKICGYDVVKQRSKVREKIGVVFQEPALDTELTGRENLDFHARMYGLSRKERKERIEYVLNLVDLVDRADDLVRSYSGGMKRRLEIARSFMHSPKVLFLDEPTLGLDARARFTVWNYIKRLNKEEGITIFLTTHYMEEADKLSDRVAIINNGKILVMGKPKELKNRIGKDVISIMCSHPEKLREIVERTDLNVVRTTNNLLVVSVNHGEEKIPMIVEVANENGIRIESISLHKPNLDDVFLHYTGRKLGG